EGSMRSVFTGTVTELAQADSWWQWLLVLTPTLFALYWWIRRKSDNLHNIYAVLFMTYGLWLAVDGVYLPAVFNSSSVRTTSIHINHAVPAKEGQLYEYLERSVGERGDYIHFFEVNFYLRNRIKNFYRQKPDSGFLLITRTDAESSLPRFEKEGYRFRLRHEADRREMQVYEFSKAQ
ncbi:MAG: dolichyl-phosphate-mannose--protein mannosyltransferase, partial [Prevotella sp.]|nr:dolichyl-phosphate-mannose--protein mannosyltransferase [Prevotella sp.]